MNPRPLVALALLAVAQGCATAPRSELRRADWVVSWSDYVENESEGLPGKIYSPAPGAVQLVETRAQFAQRQQGAGQAMGGGLGQSPPSIDEAPAALFLRAGEAKEFDVTMGALRAVRHSGAAAQSFWTTDHRVVSSRAGKTTESRVSQLILLGVQPGSATVELELGDGSQKTIEVTVATAEAKR